VKTRFLTWCKWGLGIIATGVIGALLAKGPGADVLWILNPVELRWWMVLLLLTPWVLAVVWSVFRFIQFNKLRRDVEPQLDVEQKRIIRALIDEPDGRGLGEYQAYLRYTNAFQVLKGRQILESQKQKYVLTETGRYCAYRYLRRCLRGLEY
jgi:hypothetical protein